MPAQTVAIPVDPATAEELPTDPAERQEVLVLGLREWRLRRALEAVRRGEASLARAAERGGHLAARDDSTGLRSRPGAPSSCRAAGQGIPLAR